MTDATKAEPCADVGIRTSGSQVDNDAVLKQLSDVGYDAVLKQLAEFPDLGEELQRIALQRLTEAGEIQAAMERIATLEAALRVAEHATWSASEHAALHFGVTHNIAMGCHDANLVARAALASAALAGKAAPRLTDRQIDNVTRRQCGGDLDLLLAYRQFARAIEAKVRGTP